MQMPSLIKVVGRLGGPLSDRESEEVAVEDYPHDKHHWQNEAMMRDQREGKMRY